ncbi:MAG: SH3 domain-containing protein [Polyangiaceae bacterium]|nr:SH3 domain-containing protein [Polyangiaceae bacterium]
MNPQSPKKRANRRSSPAPDGQAEAKPEGSGKAPRGKKTRPTGNVQTLSMGRVLLIAVTGCAVGILWPRLAGVSLVPEAPVQQPTNAVDEDIAAAPQPKQAQPQEVSPLERIEIGTPQVTSCRSTDGKKSKNCGQVPVDKLLLDPLKTLALCPGTEGSFGKLSLGMVLNFEKGVVESLKSGRSTSLPRANADELLRCAQKALASVNLGTVTPEQAPYVSYTVYYPIELKTPESVIQDQVKVIEASGYATVRWKVAQIREQGERDAPVLARLLSGTKVVVTGRQGEWYRVKYDGSGREGWVHGAALGLQEE